VRFQLPDANAICTRTMSLGVHIPRLPGATDIVKLKVMLSLSLITYALCHEGMGEWRHSSILDLGTRCSQVVSRGRFTPDTQWIRCWVGPRAGLDAVEKRKILRLLEN
jgi:hypothetical protein